LDPGILLRRISAARSKGANKSPSKNQNARREFPPGVKMQLEKFFSRLRPGVKTENAPLRVGTMAMQQAPRP
jgi:hypothetical protein